MIDDGPAEHLVAAINANTRELRRLREALCGSSTDPKPGGALGEFTSAVTAERFHGRGHVQGRPV